jgi:hypothetical protein
VNKILLLSLFIFQGTNSCIQSKYKDSIPFEDEMFLNPEESQTITLDRLPIILSPVPGENDWVKKLDNRYLRENDNDQQSIMVLDSSSEINPGFSKKRPIESDEQSDFDLLSRNTQVKLQPTENHIQTKSKNELIEANRRIIGEDHTTSFPGICCLAKFCDTNDDFHLNDQIDLIGIYTLDHTVSQNMIMEEEEEEDHDLFETTLPPPSLLPRIQVLSYRKLGASFPSSCNNLNLHPDSLARGLVSFNTQYYILYTIYNTTPLYL